MTIKKIEKNRGYDTVVFAAPVLIAGQAYFMGSVVIAEASKNDYYLHEVLLQKKEDEALFKTGTANGGTSGKAASPIIILLEKLNEVKQNKTEKDNKQLLEEELNQEALKMQKIHTKSFLLYLPMITVILNSLPLL